MSVLVISLLLQDPFPVFLCPVWRHRELHFPGSLTYWLWDGFSQLEALEEVECRKRGKARILLPLLCFQPGLCSIRVSSLAPPEEPLPARPVSLWQAHSQSSFCLGTSAPGLLEHCLLCPAPRMWWLLAVADLWVVLPLLPLYNQIPDLNPSA